MRPSGTGQPPSRNRTSDGGQAAYPTPQRPSGTGNRASEGGHVTYPTMSNVTPDGRVVYPEIGELARAM